MGEVRPGRVEVLGHVAMVDAIGCVDVYNLRGIWLGWTNGADEVMSTGGFREDLAPTLERVAKAAKDVTRG